ncbi:FMN-binding negative transcriptional regulator [Robiginitalea aurantiaca]|uniref:FMN-binding negative transcriptional regulator n=1 Tax=Robiginitalea aurantiaca TaxID=3056915 RepID=A0ABT7WCI2_9FLAO|nr:FMN-binding negative transcriptional regulator [Robiginitalea aurantiaca]MDM9630630.1 FMN-binding negative transcriptional regulator [Robiginitalea aurantiaca]
MYIPESYRNENPEEIHEFLKENAFGILVCNGPEGPMATHLPLELVEKDDQTLLLRGHFAKANPQWRHLEEGDEVLCIFNGPHAYISSSWYEEEEVPTWNYKAVHLKGRYRRQNEAELWEALHAMVDKYEADSAEPVSLKNMSRATLAQIRGIVGFEIQVTRLDAAFKLSQGREHDHLRIINELEKRGGSSKDVAEAMKRNSKT